MSLQIHRCWTGPDYRDRPTANHRHHRLLPPSPSSSLNKLYFRNVFRIPNIYIVPSGRMMEVYHIPRPLAGGDILQGGHHGKSVCAWGRGAIGNSLISYSANTFLILLFGRNCFIVHGGQPHGDVRIWGGILSRIRNSAEIKAKANNGQIMDEGAEARPRHSCLSFISANS